MSDTYDDDGMDDVQDFDSLGGFGDDGYVDPDKASPDDLPLDDDFANEDSPDDGDSVDFSLQTDDVQHIDYEFEENPDDMPDSTMTENPDETEPSLADENTEGRAEIEREKSQDELIAEAEPSKKTGYHENKARMFDRTKLLYIVLGLMAVLVVFFTLILPELMPKKKKTAKGMEKASVTYIPSELDSWQPDEPDIADGNSVLETQKEEIPDLESKFPPPVEERLAPISASQSSGGSSGAVSVPRTNRNEQQKQFFDVSLEKKQSTYSTGYATGNTTSRSGNGTSYGVYPATSASGYMPSAVSANMEKYLASLGKQGNSYEQQNMQGAKQEFMGKSSGQTGNYQWNGDFALWKGTVIPAVLETGINTDLPNVVTATVTTNIYSSKDGRYILIPQGSKLSALYNSSVSYGQNRVQVAWNTLIRPDGLEINLGNMQGVDAQGFAGYKGSVSNHPFEFMKALGLIAMFSIIDTKMENTIDTANNQYAQNVMANTYAEAQKLNNKIIDRALDIQPTIKIKSGTKINLITNVTIDLPPAENVPVEAKYERTH